MLVSLTFTETLVLCIGLFLTRNQILYVFRSLLPSKLANAIQRYCMSTVGIQIICRGLQCFCIFIAGVIDQDAMFAVNHRRLVIIGTAFQYDRIANMFIRIRRVNRMYRTPTLIKTAWHKFKKQSENKMGLQHIYGCLGILGDIFNIFFFIGDHMVAVYVLGLYGSFEFQVLADQISNYAWLVSSAFYIARALIGFYLIYFSVKEKSQKENLKSFITMDILRNIFELLSAYSCIYPGFIGKKEYGLFGQIISLISFKLTLEANNKQLNTNKDTNLTVK